MSATSSTLKCEDIKNQIEEIQKSINPADFPDFDLIKAKAALDNSEIGQACFYLGQYFEKNKNLKKAMYCYVAGADNYDDSNCQAKLNNVNAHNIFSFSTFSIWDFLFFPIWFILEFVFRMIYQNVFKRPIKYLTKVKLNTVTPWIILFCMPLIVSGILWIVSKFN